MINPVNPSPNVASPIGTQTVGGISSFLLSLVASISGELRDHASTINRLVSGANVATILPAYSKTALPSAVDNHDGMIIVLDDVGGRTPAFSDGTNWRRTADRNIIS